MGTTVQLGRGNTNTHRVDLPHGGHTLADKGDVVNWEVKKGSNVHAFRIEVKSDPSNIWSRSPQRVDDRNWEGELRSDAPDHAQYRYSIHWREAGGPEHPHDPIISIRPGTFHDLVIQIVAAILAALFGFFAVKAFIKKKK
jgi:hypothetical protein